MRLNYLISETLQRMDDDFIIELTLALITYSGAKISGNYAKSTNELAEWIFWFDELSLSEGPVFKLIAGGLHRHKVEVFMGSFSTPIIQQIQTSSDYQVANAEDFISLVKNAGFSIAVDKFNSTHLSHLAPNRTAFSATKTKVKDHLNKQSVLQTVTKVIAPMVSAVAELIGYEEVGPLSDLDESEGAFEGAISIRVIHARERSTRNRQLCFGFHGEVCFVCGFSPVEVYGEGISILEVHHKQPLSSLDSPKHFSAKRDLIPLCPNCHRAIHTQRPIPLTPEELKAKLVKADYAG